MPIIQKYAAASTQRINFHKSSIMFNRKVLDGLKSDSLDILQMREMSKYDKYLGLPTVWGRSKSQALQFVKECIMTKTQS